MSLSQFTRTENIQMLWDVISDEEIFRFLSPDIQGKIYDLFIDNIQGFFDIEKTRMKSLVELNKKYILLLLNYIKKTYPYKPNKIKIHDDAPVKELITFEEVQNDKKNKFDRDFNKRREEFEDSMTIKAPPVPEFLDKNSDKPIKEMDKILREMQVQRKYEVDQINRNYNNSSHVDNWLTPQETSLKTEKFKESELQELTQSGSRFKFLNQSDSELTVASPKRNSQKSNVSWNNSVEVKTFDKDEEYEDNNIFSKLKKVTALKSNEDKMHNNEHTIHETTNENLDRIAQLERNVKGLNEKMDKILEMLSNKN